MTHTPILTLELRLEHDVVLARQRARQLAGLLGFSAQDQTRIATAVSELARNAQEYAGGGRIRFAVETEPAPRFAIAVEDRGPGIPALAQILEGSYVSKTGMGLGLLGVRRLMDMFHVETSPERGTVVRVAKQLPRPVGSPSPREIARITEELARYGPESPLAEVQQQNQELLRTLEETARLNRELEDTNRGVVALYAELDEHADYLKRANEIKSQFLSNMSHEFRTPLNAIDSLSRLLLEGVAGPLGPEQEKPLTLIRQSVRDLTELVNDLLDLAKVEAGKMVVRPVELEVEHLFGALRGMLRPLLDPNRSVTLRFAAAGDLPTLVTDESKVSQILRNFISNALKYTEAGEVSVAAARGSGDTVSFSVSDTGIGIAAEDQERIWEEFVQVEGPHQKRVRGTGLGLPLCRKLAELLGGTVGVESEPGRGSVFSLVLPRCYRDAAEPRVSHSSWRLDPARLPVLFVEDNRETVLVYERYLQGSRYQVLVARTLREARQALEAFRPAAIVLDVLLERESTWDFLQELKEDQATRTIPVLVVTVLQNEPKALALGANRFGVKPIDARWLTGTLDALTSEAEAPTPETRYA